MKRGTVYFVHPVKPEVNDISGAVSYGDRSVFVNDNYVFPDLIDSRRIPHDYLRRMKEAAVMFNPTTDYLAIVGDHLQLVVFSGLLMQRHGMLRVLRWDRDAKGYLPVHTDGFPLDA